MAAARSAAHTTRMHRHRARRRRVLAVAFGAALTAHAVALGIQDAAHQVPVRLRLAPPPARPDVRLSTAAIASAIPSAVTLVPAGSLAVVTLLEIVPGPGDAAAFTGLQPLPSVSVDLPGVRAADRGGGTVGGAATWTDRRDPDQTALRSQLWSDPDAYRAPRRDLDRRAATAEAVTRAPARAWGDRQVRRAARAGEVDPSRGDRDHNSGVGAAPAEAWRDADPVFDAAAGRTAQARRDGATQPSSDGALVDRGATAVDVQRHGAAGDDVSVAAASDQRNPDPYDLTPSRAGGHDGEGVAGEVAGNGALADGRAGGAGTGASRADTATGRGGTSVMATRTDPYLRELLRRLEGEITFPHDLKIDLRSGRVIAQLTLGADGRIGNITIKTSSGFDGFDQELRRALGALGKLGRVPAALLDGKIVLQVSVPYTFRNPMIR